MYNQIFYSAIFASVFAQSSTAQPWKAYTYPGAPSATVETTSETTATGTAATASSATSTSAAGAYIKSESVGSSVSYAVNIPSSGSQDLYIQITGPTSMSWIGLGQGSSMTGANMFIIYSNADGTNVTLSGRQGQGEVEPTAASDSTLTLLAGSGIAKDVMTANLLCTNCQSWTGGSMSYTSTSTSWTWAYHSGSSINSDSSSATITQHTSYGTTSFDLASATGGDSSNPFVGISTTSISGATSGSGDGSTTSSLSYASISPTLILAHGVLAALAFVAIFPLGSIVIRLLTFKHIVFVHATAQIIGYILALGALATGTYIAIAYSLLTTPHAIIGLIIIASLFLQPFLGFLHHALYNRYGKRTAISYIHIWLGRICILIGGINGGLGLILGNVEKGRRVAYWIVLAIMWAVWSAAIAVGEKRRASEGMKRGRSIRSRRGMDEGQWGNRVEVGTAQVGRRFYRR